MIEIYCFIDKVIIKYNSWFNKSVWDPTTHQNSTLDLISSQSKTKDKRDQLDIWNQREKWLAENDLSYQILGITSSSGSKFDF